VYNLSNRFSYKLIVHATLIPNPNLNQKAKYKFSTRYTLSNKFEVQNVSTNLNPSTKISELRRAATTTEMQSENEKSST